MAKFNLKTIVMKDYGIDHLEASNFSDFVYITLKLNVVLGEDYKEKLVSDQSSNKKDFIKSLVRRMEKHRDLVPHNYKQILDMMDQAEEKPNPAYEELRVTKLELEQVKSKNLDLSKRLIEITSKEGKEITKLSENLEISSRVINEFNHYISEFPELASAFKTIRAVHGKASFNKRNRLKQLLIDADMSEVAAEQLLNDYSKQTLEIFNQERCENVDFEKSEHVIRASRDLFKFVMNNKEFVEACMALKQSGNIVACANTTDSKPDPRYHIGIKEKEDDYSNITIDTESVCLSVDFLVSLDRVFVSKIDHNGNPVLNKFATAAVSIFVNNIKHEICETIGLECEVYNRNTYIKKDKVAEFIERFNRYAMNCLKGARK